MLDKTALIIDDSATARLMLKNKLKKFDVIVESAADGFEALQLLQSRQPDIIFLDHIMPGMDGFQVLEQLKAKPLTKDIPVIMYTSQAAPKYTDEARALGAIGVMPKQVTTDILSQMLDKAEQYHQGTLRGEADTLDNTVPTEPSPGADNGPEPLAGPLSKATVDLDDEAQVDHAGHVEENRHQRQGSLVYPLIIIFLILVQLYWFYRDQQQQLLITSLTGQLQQQQAAYQQAVDDVIDLRIANQVAMDQFQFVMDALVSQVLDKAAMETGALAGPEDGQDVEAKPGAEQDSNSSDGAY